MKKLIYLMMASSFLGAQIFSIDIGIMKMSIFRITTIILLFLMLTDYMKNSRKIRLTIKIGQDYIIKFYFFWFIYSIFSLLWVKDYNAWLKAIFFIGSGFTCIWILSTYVNTKTFFYNIFKIMLFMFVLHNIIGWSELLTGNYVFADLSKIDVYNQFKNNAAVRVPVSMMGNTNDFATLVLCGIFISLITLSNSKSKMIKIVSIINIISSTILLWRTNSRANMLGLILGILVLLILKFYKKITKKSLLALISLLLLLVAVLVVNSSTLNSAYDLITEKIKIGGNSDSIRLNLIINGLIFLKRTILFGTGAGNIEYWMENNKLYNVGSITNMHNWWFEILVGYGLIIFIGYIISYYMIIKSLYKSYKSNNDKFIENTSLYLLCYMVAFIVSSISSSSNMSSEWLWVFWAVTIAYIGYIEISNSRIKKDAQTIVEDKQ